MIQYIQYSAIDYYPAFRVNLYDEMTSVDYKPLVVYKSQFTGKELIALPYSIYLNAKDRYIGITMKIIRLGYASDPSAGTIQFSTTDYPLGFYDVTIYQNNNDTNMVVANTIKKLYTGLMNIKLQTLVGSTVDYTEYTTNDTDTESVYITP